MIATKFSLRLNLCIGRIFRLQLIYGICTHIVDLEWNYTVGGHKKLVGVECFNTNQFLI